MIKTMLLTAQLALSPIVGTNGLQPKRLPNPVYGESVDMSVTYNGTTYQRVCYNPYRGENIMPNQNLLIGFNTWETRQQMTIYPASVFDGATFPSLYPYQFNISWSWNSDNYAYYSVNWDDQTYGEGMPPLCLSFWYVDEDMLLYEELFFLDADLEECVITEWDGSQANNQWTYARQWGGNPYIPEGGKLYTRQQNWNIGTSWNRIIQDEQPKVTNPSVYDNIYNFYYQNLFANEALDELGAEVGNNSLTMRQWLAHTATIVSISLLACALVVLVIKIFKLIAGSISDIWG